MGISGIYSSQDVKPVLDRTPSVSGSKPVEGKSPFQTGDSFTRTSQSSPEDQQIEKLKQRDADVRRHEAAHAGTAGGLAEGTSFTYEAGPDGKQYAIGGEVQIDISAVPGDPTATIAKMERVRRAALAPADPSPQDQQVAAQATVTEAKARQELADKAKTSSPQQKTTESRFFPTTSLPFQRSYPSAPVQQGTRIDARA